MMCKNCGTETRVEQTAKYDGVMYRRRKCPECKRVFYSKEIEADDQDEGREAVNAKIYTRMRR